MFTSSIERSPPFGRPRARLLFLAFLLLVSASARAEKTDVVLMKNGDRVTGEVKSLDRGVLEFSTDHMGTIYIDWVDIDEIISGTGQVLELVDGRRIYGPLAKSEDEKAVLVNSAQGVVAVRTDEVMMMYPVEAGFWDRLDLSASAGFSWDKGSNVAKLHLGLDAEYRDPRFITQASFSTEITKQDSGESSERTVLDAERLVFRKTNRYRAFFGNIESNDQLDIDLRVLAGVGYGVVPIRSQSNRFILGAGLAVNYEVPTRGTAETNLEAVGTMGYHFYLRSDLDRSFDTQLRVFPSITDAGRWRAAFDMDFNWELVNDFFWSLDFYASYDSEPISTDAATSDYGVNSSLGYKF